MTPMIVEHPLLQHKLSILRNKQTGTKEFRDLVGEIATLLCYEATRDLPLEEVEIETPITMAKTKVLAGRKLALVPILRAGMGMLDGMLTCCPPLRSASSACTATRRPCSPWSISASCRRTSPSATFWCLTRCWLPAAVPSTPSPRSRSTAQSTSSSSASSLLRKASRPCTRHIPMWTSTSRTGRPPERERLHRPGLGDAGDRIYGTK